MSDCIPIELRAHDAYTDCLDGGHRGYQAACWDCDWRGMEYLRGDEEMGTEESRAHKRNAQTEADAHRSLSVPCCSKCRSAVSELTRTL